MADLTGSNPNVYYELGIADAFRVPVIRFVDNASSLPFDARPDRTIELPDADGAIEVLSANSAKETFHTYATDAFSNRTADSVVTMAELRATWDAQPSEEPTQGMLRALLQEMDDLRRPRTPSNMTDSATEIDVLSRLASAVENRYRGAEVLSSPDGCIVDFGKSISESAANHLLERFSEVVGNRHVVFLHGTHADLSDPVYGDEEPF